MSSVAVEITERIGVAAICVIPRVGDELADARSKGALLALAAAMSRRYADNVIGLGSGDFRVIESDNGFTLQGNLRAEHLSRAIDFCFGYWEGLARVAERANATK